MLDRWRMERGQGEGIYQGHKGHFTRVREYFEGRKGYFARMRGISRL